MAEKYGEVPPKFTKKWWEYFWDYYKWHVIITVVAVLIASVTIVQCATRPKYDMNVVYAGHMNYSEEEIDGFKRVAYDMNINSIDLVTIMPTSFRLYRDNDYPPLRGTMFSLDRCRHFLYTRGYVEYYGTYPGKYIPNPIEVRLFSFDESPEQICREILSLTKMNWNNTQFDRKFPITIDCSRNVGEILKYVSPEQKPQIKYSFYM